MRNRLMIFFLVVTIISTTAFDCPKMYGTYPHEWNKAVYYRCSNDCPYQENCPTKSYYSSTTNQCELGSAVWSPRYDLTGRYYWPSSTVFLEIGQVNYNVQWTSDDGQNIATFIGRYVNETTVTGIEINLVKNTDCITIQDFDLSVSGKRQFCRSRVSQHWYSRTCGIALSLNHCHSY